MCKYVLCVNIFNIFYRLKVANWIINSVICIIVIPLSNWLFAVISPYPTAVCVPIEKYNASINVKVYSSCELTLCELTLLIVKLILLPRYQYITENNNTIINVITINLIILFVFIIFINNNKYINNNNKYIVY